ncbi:MAG: VWA domain-containing protein [Myxococcota bacterium]
MNIDRRTPTAGLVFATALPGCQVDLAHPWGLLWLVLVPVLIASAVLTEKRRETLMRRFAGSMASRLVFGLDRRRRRLRITLLALGLGAILVALSGLRVGYRWETTVRRGVDIMIALDISRSMDARDADSTGKLSRLARAKREIVDLLDRAQGDRIGLVVFAGTAVVRCPLTTDYRTVKLLLDGVTTGLLPIQGTDLGQALDTALDGFKRGPGKSQAVVLITDGEDHLDRVQVAGQRAKDAGVRVFGLGVGETEGAPVPGERGGFHTSRSGDVVVSRLDESSLEQIALLTDGHYLRSVTGELDLERIYTDGIRRDVEARSFSETREKNWFDRFQWLVALALVVLAVEAFLGDSRGESSSSRPEP